MNCSLSYISAKPSPAFQVFNSRHHFIPIASKNAHSQQQQQQPRLHGSLNRIGEKLLNNCWSLKTSSLAIQVGTILAAVDHPALAVTGVNNEEDLTWRLTQLGIIAFWYFLIMPPIILNWLRLRWYKRMLLEMYLQFMFMFMFFPGVLLWAPFVNFRRLPRDPTMKYPWSTPQDPSLTDSQTR